MTPKPLEEARAAFVPKFEIVVRDGDDHVHFEADGKQPVLEFLDQFLDRVRDAVVLIRRRPG